MPRNKYLVQQADQQSANDSDGWIRYTELLKFHKKLRLIEVRFRRYKSFKKGNYLPIHAFV